VRSRPTERRGLDDGVTYLRGAARPSRRSVSRTVPLVVLFVVGSIVLGRLG